MSKGEITYKIDNGNIKILCYYPENTEQRDGTMKIESLKIENVGGISSLSLDNFNPNLNIICGENGIGKTNILDCIASLFSYQNPESINVKSGLDKGSVNIVIDGKSKDRPITKKHTNIAATYDKDQSDPYLLYLKVNRVFNYKKEEYIKSDPAPKDIISRNQKNSTGLENNDIKQWIVSRYFYTGRPEDIAPNQISNFELAKKCFSLLDDRFKFIKSGKDHEIIVQTPSGEIYFELLSSGFKSTLFILLGIIKEIEYRFQRENILASNFDGIILIDEIELHLHPEWQGKICPLLTEVFPNTQFIVTTHSPHVVQSAEVNQVIALGGENGDLEKRTLDIAPHGFKGWTIEEILTDVMGMKDTRTNLYRDIKKKFDDALDSKDLSQAKIAYQQLDELLHPSYPLRPLFKMQLDGLED